jgi:putative ABC transport system permease protein
MGALYLGWRYLRHHRSKSAILVASITLILYLPVALSMLVEEGAASLRARAAATPLLLGARGSPVELTLNSLYFATDTPALTNYQALAQIEPGRAGAIPLYVRHQARRHPIVGTTIDYLDYRSLRLTHGRGFAVLGEAVLGANVAAALAVGVGDSVVSSPETVFDLAGIYPLKMSIVGVLAPTFTADDNAIFVDVKTTWVIEGLGHGHQDLTQADARTSVLKRTDEVITANAALMQYNEITAENRSSFHFHGDASTYPLTAVLALPLDERSSALLQGSFLDHEHHQLIRPNLVMDKLLETVFTIQRYFLLGVVLVGVATVTTAILVFMLSYRLRRGEFATLTKIGGARSTIALLGASEVGFVVVTSVVLAGALVILTSLVSGEALVLLLTN